MLLLRVKRIRIHSFTLLLFLFALSAVGQIPAPPEIPNSFRLDMQTAARLRPQLMADSEPPGGRYSTGELVFKRLLQFVPSSAASFKWQLRIVDNDQLNAYASPDGDA